MLALLLLLPAAAAPPADQWILVVAGDFEKAAAPLVAQRRAQGMRVAVVTAGDVLSVREMLAGDTRPLRKKIADLCNAWHGRSSVLLLGAVSSAHTGRVVPPCVGTHSRMKGQPTDAPYGLPDADGMPSVAVGRMPARDEAEARAMVAKTLAMEKMAAGWWKREINVLAGIPAFNPVVDRLVESMAFARFDRIHPSWGGRAIYTSASSRFTLPPARLRRDSFHSVGRGQAVLLYLGHSDPTGLWGGDDPFLSRDDFAKVTIPGGGGVFVTLGCNGCQLAGKDGEGYGVAAIRNPQGPAAVFGSHGVCFAAMCQLAADGLVEKAFVGEMPARLGECHLAALAGVAKGKMDFLTFRMLDAADGDPKIPQATQRREHLEMFLLLGDPALRLPRVAEDLEVTAPRTFKPGGEVTLTGTLPARCKGGRVEVSLERTAGTSPEGLVPVPEKKGAERDAAILKNHQAANDFRIAHAAGAIEGVGFRVTLKVPEKMAYKWLNLRVRCVQGEEEAFFFRRLEIEP